MDRARFDTLYTPEIQSRMIRCAMNLMKHPQDAEDLVQETLIRAFERLDCFKSGPFWKWLRQIMMYRFYNELRFGKTRRKHILRQDSGKHRHVHFDHPGLRMDLDEAIDDLDSKQGSVVRLVCEMDYSYDEAAQAMGIPIGTIMSRLYRGRSALQEKLQSCAS